MYFDTKSCDDCLTEQEVIDYLVRTKLQDFEEFIDKLVWQLDEDKKRAIGEILNKYKLSLIHLSKKENLTHSILTDEERDLIIQEELAKFNQTSSIKIINEMN